MNWQPIETAPKDETNFLVFEDGKMAVGHFWSAAGRDYFNIAHVGGYEAEFEIDHPTHWMALPEPPQ